MRFYGAIGYAEMQEETPAGSGVWKEIITEITYYGDVIRNSRRLVPSNPPLVTLNDNLSLENSFSILADAYAYANIMQMRYVVWQGSRWSVTNAEVMRPRLILTIGGLWNGNTP